eukprot:TRINITY_DN18359_c0_g1_i1.p1 TRINITY_DN18359_c0_g1~~TRINITY_DN18359_c0_g1_i1.p1  ORF type:complete len:309 (+),score=66.69 TRINITY_DN18359_c0_g1_i1:41-967(+)
MCVMFNLHLSVRVSLFALIFSAFFLSCFFFLMIRRPPRSTHCISSAASDVYKRQYQRRVHGSRQHLPIYERQTIDKLIKVEKTPQQTVVNRKFEQLANNNNKNNNNNLSNNNSFTNNKINSKDVNHLQSKFSDLNKTTDLQLLNDIDNKTNKSNQNNKSNIIDTNDKSDTSFSILNKTTDNLMGSETQQLQQLNIELEELQTSIQELQYKNKSQNNIKQSVKVNNSKSQQKDKQKSLAPQTQRNQKPRNNKSPKLKSSRLHNQTKEEVEIKQNKRLINELDSQAPNLEYILQLLNQKQQLTPSQLQNL